MLKTQPKDLSKLIISGLALTMLIVSLSTFNVPEAYACGGLFCDNTQPVNQVAERILFAPDSETDTMHMHVQLTYQGPPDDFGWLLPVPAGTQFGLSRPALFSELDSRYQPTFTLRRIQAEYCPPRNRSGGIEFAAQASPEALDQEPAVQVTSQNQVGPYDQVTLNATTVEALVEWLETNGYQVPPNAEESLSPYLENYEFLAIKLASGRESGDIQPVALSYTGTIASIPLRPTAVAADPDMGVIVHLLGPHRGIPSNFQLVELNLAALNWFNPSQHYAQLVSHAIDESADGHAFVTDFAGPHSFPAHQITPSISSSLVLAMEGVRDSEQMYEVLERLLANGIPIDLDQVLLGVLPLTREENQLLINFASDTQSDDFAPEPRSDSSVESLIYGEDGEPFDVDGAAIAEALRVYNDAGKVIRRLFLINSYLTRLYTTLNPSEMNLDPSFDFNPDLDNVDNEHVAQLFLNCDGLGDYILTPDGLEIDLSESREEIARQDGNTSRGVDTIGAAVISRPMSSGQPEIIADQRETLIQIYKRKLANSNNLFGCEQGVIGERISWLSLVLFLLTFARIRQNTGRPEED